MTTPVVSRWQRSSPLTRAGDGDGREIWTSPNGARYELRSRYGKPVNPLAIKGSIEAFANEVDRVRACVSSMAARCRFEDNPACPICGSDRCSPGLAVHGIEYVECDSCTHAYTRQRLTPEDLDAYYRDAAEYVPVHVSPATAKARVEAIANPKIDLVLDEFRRVYGRRPEHLLDVGAGAGHIVAAARAKGLAADGLEPSTIGRDSCRALHGIELLADDFLRFDAATSRPPFDVLTFWGVLEHTTDPLAYLGRARQLLAGGGLLFMEVPRYETFSTVLERILPNLGTRHLDGIEHINCFTDASAATMLERAGFAPCFVWYLGLDWYEFAMRMLYRFRDVAVTQFVLDHFDTFQQFNDGARMADGMIVGARVIS